jgi:hypothetical protein
LALATLGVEPVVVTLAGGGPRRLKRHDRADLNRKMIGLFPNEP